MFIATNKIVIKNKEIEEYAKISNKKNKPYIEANKNNKETNIIEIFIKESKINSIIFTYKFKEIKFC